MYEKPTLFHRFGGTRKMADELGEPASTVQSWKSAGRIPAAHQPKVLTRARELGIAISAEDVIFPLGRPSIPDTDASATEAEFTAAADDSEEADSRRPFSVSPPTCSSTRAPSGSCSSPACSTGEADARAL